MTVASTFLTSDVFGQVRRVRHETRRRVLTVTATQTLTPGMRRITLHSADLADFVSQSPDDHIKLFIPGTDGETVMRDYTPRRFNADAGDMVIDFAVHDVAGPATHWACSAKPGDNLEIGGPRGSAIVPEVFDWYLLVGDETALPAIGRRLEEFGSGTAVSTVVVVNVEEDRQDLKTAAQWRPEWIFRSLEGPDDIAAAILRIDRLYSRKGVGFIWIAGEAQFARSLRAHVMNAHGHTPLHMKAAGYWRRGDAGAHEPLD